ncbi:alpha/beta hydrolase family protein [Actinomycetospora atypica]|uniref:Alpha/beta hydrolase family protein n=1 Tax=Actinomycetospora atypica TaxID=1290095 RepID=A0ABV9YT47_9PSEU
MAIGLSTLPGVLLTYPALGEAVPCPYGRFEIEAVLDAAVVGQPPLVLLSHGTGTAPDVYRGLAADLAHAGLAVAALSHAGNRLGDDTLAGTAEVLTRRTRQAVEAADLALEALGRDGSDRHRVGVVGHSLGAATALALAGARPSTMPWETADATERPIEVSRDARVAALVLLMPATPWFGRPGALADVDAATLMLTAEHDDHTPAWHGEILTAGMPHLTHHVVGGGHFAALTHFGPRAVAAGLPPALDPPGFDRAAAQRRWHPRVADWLTTHLRDAAVPAQG